MGLPAATRDFARHEPVATSPRGRRCAADGCDTILSVYTPEDYCWQHRDMATEKEGAQMMTDYPDTMTAHEVRAYLASHGMTIGINRMRTMLKAGTIPTLPAEVAGKRAMVGRAALDRLLVEWGVVAPRGAGRPRRP